MLTFNGFLDEQIQNKYTNRLTKRLMNDNNYNNNNNNNYYNNNNYNNNNNNNNNKFITHWAQINI